MGSKVKTAVKLTDAQRRAFVYFANGQIAHPGVGSAVMVNGVRICNIDTLMSLKRAGLIEQGGDYTWAVTTFGKSVSAEMKLDVRASATQPMALTPEHIMRDIRERNNLAPDDRSSDAELQAMAPIEKFRQLVGFQMGDPKWADQMITWASQCGIQIADPR